MKAIIIYKSKTGFTKKYALWIQGVLHCDMVSDKNVAKRNMNNYDTVIIGSYIRIEKIRGIQKMKEAAGKNKQFVYFATGASPEKGGDFIEGIWEKSIGKDECDRVPHFYMESGLSYEKMSIVERLLMKVFAAIMKRQGRAGLDQSYDNSSPENIKPLLNYLRVSS